MTTISKKKTVAKPTPSAKAKASFSSSEPAGKSTATCPMAQAKKPPKPCAIDRLALSEQSDKSLRVIHVAPGQARRRGTSPVMIESGDKFQVTAGSKEHGKARTVDVTVEASSTCAGATHPVLSWSDAQGIGVKATKKQSLQLFRDPLPGDGAGSGFFAVLNSVTGFRARQYPLSAQSCGVPTSWDKEAAAQLGATVEVYPADQFTLELEFPAFLKPDALKFTTATKNWTSQRALDEKQIKQAGDEIDDVYTKDKEFYREYGIVQTEVRKFAEEQEKRKLGFIESNPEGLKVSLKQTDGEHTVTANIDEVVKLVRMVRSAEYRFKEFNEWLHDFQVGPGVRFKASCQFLVLKLSANWGYKEYIDDRVFLAYGGSAEIDIISAELDASLGWKLAGMADLLLVLKGAGTISLSIPEITKETPDDPPRVKVAPRGQVKFSGGVEGRGMWVATAEGTISVTFRAETENLNVLSDKGILSGEIVVARDRTIATVTASCWLYGKTTSKTYELVKGDPDLAHFSFGHGE